MALANQCEELLDDIEDCYSFEDAIYVIESYALMWLRRGKQIAYEEMEDD